MAEQAERGGIQVIDRATAIMEVVSRDDGLPLSTIARRAGIATSTAHRILTSLEANGLIAMDDDRKLWFVGVRAFEIGSGFLRNRKPVEVGREIMRALMEETGETVNMAVVDQGEAVYIGQVECHNAIRAFHRPGSRGPVHCSGVGKSLLAWRSEAEVERILRRHGMASFTRFTITHDGRFFDELAQIRRRRWAVDDQERLMGMRCVAAPIFDEHGEPVTGISVSGPTVRITPERMSELGPQVRQAAEVITTRIGGRLPNTRDG